MTTIVERPDGYDTHETDVVRSLAGAELDDQALADAERDNRSLGQHYYEKMTAPITLTPGDEDKIAQLLNDHDIAEAEASTVDTVPFQQDRIVGTIALPLENRELGEMLAAWGRVFPGSYMQMTGVSRGQGYEQEIRIYVPTGDDDG
jgi:hypothetical protein